mmetsp:Transcript_39777/g.88412  ORF Transcript_39777/g.88412 Transcript_39777/m.88412 type:complete len:111 (-) Transcript_39777:382-714(-)
MLASKVRPTSSSSSVRAAAPPAAAAVSRRTVFLSAPLTVLLAGAASPALAYGGAKELRALDEGSGNRDYDALMAIVKKRKAEAAAGTAGAPAPAPASAAPASDSSSKKAQ